MKKRNFRYRTAVLCAALVALLALGADGAVGGGPTSIKAEVYHAMDSGLPESLSDPNVISVALLTDNVFQSSSISTFLEDLELALVDEYGESAVSTAAGVRYKYIPGMGMVCCETREFTVEFGRKDEVIVGAERGTQL